MNTLHFTAIILKLLEKIFDEFKLGRKSTIAIFNSFSIEIFSNSGTLMEVKQQLEHSGL